MSATRPTLALALVLVAACYGPGIGPRRPETPREVAEERLLRDGHGTSILVCGERYDIGAPVVLWSDPGGYDANRPHLHFEPPAAGIETPPDGEPRFDAGRVDRASGASLVAPDASLPELAALVDQFVVHYDVCGTSRMCFKVLHDRRGLSVHFMLDLDGTIYQTMDLVHQAWHASQANTRSIGVEIANIGAYPPGGPSPLDEWYVEDESGTYIRLPAARGDGGIRTPDFVGQPRRIWRVRGAIHERPLEQYDLTPQQQRSLTKLAAGLCRLFPRMAPDAPRDGGGRVRVDALSDEEWRTFGGILGHYHLTTRKIDPGPAFDWEPFLAGVRRELGARP